MRSPLLRALCALMMLFLLAGLCACSMTEIPSETAAPTDESGRDPYSGAWIGNFEVGDELMQGLGFDLRERLAWPLEAELRLELEADGRCRLLCDYAPCRGLLEPAIAEAVRELQEQESGESLSGLALAEALGADPYDFAAALCDELLPPTTSRSGRLNGDKTQITWADGSVSPLRAEDGALWLFLPEHGEVRLRPAG